MQTVVESDELYLYSENKAFQSTSSKTVGEDLISILFFNLGAITHQTHLEPIFYTMVTLYYYFCA